MKGLYKQLERADQFGHEVGFNLDGETSIKSAPGIFVSLLLLFVLVAYGVSRLNALLLRANPQITVSTLQQYFDSSKIVNFDDIGFKVAFAVEQYDDNRAGKDDPNYVEWIVQLTQNIGKIETIFPLKFHKCTDEDYDSFYEPALSYKAMFAAAKSRKNFYCIDEGQNVEVFGMGDQTDYKRLDFMMLPCKPHFDTNGNSICNTTLQQRIDYLGSVDLVVMTNNMRLNSLDFTNKALIKETRFQNKQFNEKQPAFINSLITLQQVSDTIDYLQLGQQNDQELFSYSLGVLQDSAWTTYPQRYKFIGVEILLEFDYLVYSRQTYDFLQWFGDLGGLNEALHFMGSLLVASYAVFNSGSFLVSRLFTQSTKSYQNSRSIMKRKISEIIQAPKDEGESEGGFDLSKNIFKLMQIKAAQSQAVSDFQNRAEIVKPSFCAMLCGCLCRNKDIIHFFKLQKRSTQKIDQEMDILRFIRTQRFTAVSLYGLLSRNQRKFSEKIADNILSEYSTPVSSDKDSDQDLFVPPKPTNWGKKPIEKEYDFLEQIITSQNDIDKRLVHVYERKDLWRTKKWELANPEVANRQNIKQLKMLISMNLTKKRNSQPQHYDIIQRMQKSGNLNVETIRARKRQRQKIVLTNDVKENERDTEVNGSLSSITDLTIFEKPQKKDQDLFESEAKKNNNSQQYLLPPSRPILSKKIEKEQAFINGKKSPTKKASDRQRTPITVSSNYITKDSNERSGIQQNQVESKAQFTPENDTRARTQQRVSQLNQTQKIKRFGGHLQTQSVSPPRLGARKNYKSSSYDVHDYDLYSGNQAQKKQQAALKAISLLNDLEEEIVSGFEKNGFSSQKKWK